MKVLIADPDWRFAHQAQRFLESHAHQVVHMGQFRDAIEQATHWRPDMVILAAEFARKEFLDQFNRTIPRPAVLLTEHMDRYDRAWRAWQVVGDELLMKPVFNSHEIHMGVVMALEAHAAGSRSGIRDNAAISA